MSSKNLFVLRVMQNNDVNFYTPTHQAEWVITGAEYANMYGTYYEIGIRDTALDSGSPDHFTLVQCDLFGPNRLIDYGRQIIVMLQKGLSPSDIVNVYHADPDEDIYAEDL